MSNMLVRKTEDKGSYHGAFCLNAFGMAEVLHIVCVSGGWPRLTVVSGRRRPGQQVTALFLGNVGFRAMDCLYMLPERAGVRVAFSTAGNLTYIRFLQMTQNST